MQPDGIVRNLDCLGRVVIPKELRRKLEINEGDAVAIVDEGNKIIIRKCRRGCVFCGSQEGLIEYRDMCVCSRCRKSLNNKVVLVEEV